MPFRPPFCLNGKLRVTDILEVKDKHGEIEEITNREEKRTKCVSQKFINFFVLYSPMPEIIDSLS